MKKRGRNLGILRENEREIERDVCKALREIFVTLKPVLGVGYKGKRRGEKVEGNDTKFSSKSFPRVQIFLGKNRYTAVIHPH